MAESVVTFLLNELSVWLHEEQKLLGALGNEVQIIVDKLDHMRAFLKVADAEEETDPQLKVWVGQVREIAYDIEDVLERYELLFAYPHSHGIKGRLKMIWASVKNLKVKHQLASKLQAINLRAEESSKTYNDTYAHRSNSTILGSDICYDGRGDALLLEDDEILGIDEPKEVLLDWLSSGDYAQKVVSVVGMAGLGKTTLVKKVYDDPMIKRNFNHRAWISVSESFNIDNLLREIIIQLLKEVNKALPPELEGMNAHDMREFIYKFLHNKRYTIVLDDIWRMDTWEALRYSFPRSNTQGRGCIIITTRFKDIGDIACCESGNHVFYLKPLPRQEAEKLFYRKAFPNNACPENLKGISKTIIVKCEGWPLAIVVVGGLLATKKNNLEEWRKFSLHMTYELEGHHFRRIRKLLSLSYYDLPYYLKACFLHLSVFPEDHVLEKGTIIRLWSAEGFVEAQQRRTKGEIVEGYLNELCNRSLIQVTKRSKDGRTKRFRLHDLVREYIILKAREQNIVATLNQGDNKCKCRIRCLVLDDSSITCIEQISTFKHLRSLLYFGSANQNWEPIFRKILHGDCRMMKTLDLRGAPLDTIPDEVFKLYHLRCLCLRDTNISFIPKSIGNLGKLETLDLKRTIVTALPVEILKLQRLRYLLIYSFIQGDSYFPLNNVKSFKAPYHIGQLLCLETLNCIDVSVTANGIKIVSEIGKLTKLRRLGIVGLRREDGNEFCCSLAKLGELRSLRITSVEEYEALDLDYPLCLPLVRTLVLKGCLQSMPKWISSLNDVTILRLRFSRLVEDPLRYLQGLPSLQILSLHSAYEGEEMSFNGGGFKRLKILYLIRLSGLKRVRMEKRSMPCLQELQLRDCKELLELPDGIHHLTALQSVKFFDMAPQLVHRASKMERHTKLAHVPSVRIFNWDGRRWKRRMFSKRKQNNKEID